jgi:hypothetical protein
MQPHATAPIPTRPEPAGPTPFPRWSARLQQVGSAPALPDADAQLLLPRAGETVSEYAARLRALHSQLATLLEAVERGMGEAAPAPAAVAPRPGVRRPAVPAPRVIPPPGSARLIHEPPVDRRLGLEDRRRDLPDSRTVRVERRAGLHDRRAVQHAPSVDVSTMFWIVNVAAWIVVTVVVLLWGLA